ncbi:MAG: hypothetical protein ACTSRI_10615 [Promethearchaeota archaeon]
MIDKINGHYGKSYATQHDIVLKFVNERIFFKGKGSLTRNLERKEKPIPT